MANNEERRKVIKGHGVKGKRHDAKLEAFQNLVMLTNSRWQNLPHP